MLPRCAARAAQAATSFDDCGGSAGSPDTMEMGGGEQQWQWQQQPQLQRGSSEQRVTVAATEVLEQEGNNRESAARSRHLLAQAVNIALQGLVAGFGCFFAYVWVDSFRKGRFNKSVGVVTVMFVGTIVFAWICRRRLVPMVRSEERMVVGRELQPRPKDNARQTRQGFDYFVYPVEESSTSTGSETSASCSDDDSGVNMPSAASEPVAAFTDIEAPAGYSNNGVGDESAASSGEVALATPPSVSQELNRKKSCSSASGDNGAAPLVPCEAEEDESWAEMEKAQRCAVTTAKTTGSFSWITSATPAGCMVCLDSYKAKDRVCRIPCGHVFHAECIESWLDQNPSCPECRLELQSNDVEEMRRAPPSSPASTLPDEAFQISFSNRAEVFSPAASTAAVAPPPVTSPPISEGESGSGSGSGSASASASGSESESRSSTAPPPPHPDISSTSRICSPASAASIPQAEPSAQRRLSCEPGRASTAAPTTTTTPARVQASAEADTSADMTEINTAINAATAPFARYFGGSPVSEGPSSPTFSVVRFVGLSPEPGRQQQGDKQFGTPARTPDPATTPQPSSVRAPFACFDSPPCHQGAFRGYADMMSQSPAPGDPYAWFLDSPSDYGPPSSTGTPQPQPQPQQPPPPADLGWSPYSPGSSDAGEAFADLTELNTVINATAAREGYALNSATVAPFAHYFESFESPTSIVRFVSQEFDQQDVPPYRSAARHVPGHAASSSMVPFRSPAGAGSGLGPAPFAHYLESPSYYSTSPSYYSASPLATANMAHFPLSPNFMRTPSAADREESGGEVTAPHRIVPYYPAVPFRRRQQHQQQHQQHQQPHQCVGANSSNGEDDEQGRQAHFGEMESISPPRAPPRLVLTPSPAVGRRGPWRGETHASVPTPTPAQSERSAQPTGGAALSPFAVEVGRAQDEIPRQGSGTADCWVWPLSSASIWDNKAWPTIGGRVRIDSLDEAAQVCQEGRGHNNVRQDQESAQPAMPPPVGGSGGGRWVWQADEPSERVAR